MRKRRMNITVKLGDYVSIKTGKLDANVADENGIYPFFTCSVEPLKINSYHYDCECVLVAGNGDLNVKYYNGKFDAYQRTYIIETNNKSILSVPYLYFFLDKYVETLRKQSIGGVIKYIKLGNLTEAQIPLCDITTQNAIVNKLKKVNELISDRNLQLSKLDELVKSRFVEMFEDNSYPIFRLGDVCTKITDGTHKTPNYLDFGVTFISAKNIVNGELDFTDVKYISDQEYAQIQNRCQTELGDILLSKSGSLGAPVIVKTGEKIGLFESLAVLKYDRRRLLSAFLCEQLKTDNVQRQFRVGTKGVAVKHLHLGVISDTKIIVPPIEAQEQFATFVEQTDKLKFEVKQSLEQLETLKKSLMQQYFG